MQVHGCACILFFFIIDFDFDFGRPRRVAPTGCLTNYFYTTAIFSPFTIRGMAHQFNPKKHHRRSIRLKGYDYARPGAYFITICVQDKKHLFGEIQEGQMFLNDAGVMIEKWYSELAIKYPDKKCHEMVVMPNHFHCIIDKYDFAQSQAGAGGCPAYGS